MVKGSLNLSVTYFRLGPGAFRVLLALLVVGSHLSALNIGRPAVFAFFVLSGYWVTKMYDEKYRAYGSVWIFYQSRFLRIWLPFAASYLIFFALLSLFGPEPSASKLAGLTLLGVASHKKDVLGTTWSLDIEIQFYLFVPLLWAALQVGSVRFGRSFAGILATGTVLLGTAGWYLQLDFEIENFLAYLLSFVIGAAIWRFGMRFSGRAALLSVGIFLVLGLGLAVLPETRPLLWRPEGIELSPLFQDLSGMAWVAVMIPLIAWNVRQRTGAFDMHLGNYSYALYVTHWPVIVLLRHHFGPLSIMDKGLVLGVLLIVATLFYVSVDRSCERFRASYIQRLRRGGWAMKIGPASRPESR